MAEPSVVDRLERELAKFQDTLTDVRDRVIKIEARDHAMMIERNAKRLNDQESRIRALEFSDRRRDGAAGALDWLAKNGPAIVSFIFALIIGVMIAKGFPG